MGIIRSDYITIFLTGFTNNLELEKIIFQENVIFPHSWDNRN